MFEIAPFPDVVLKLGHYLGSSIDVGAAMTTKILTQNGQVLQKSMYRSLSPHEITDKDGLYAQDQFVVRVYEKLGSLLLPSELRVVGPLSMIIKNMLSIYCFTIKQLRSVLGLIQKYQDIGEKRSKMLAPLLDLIDECGHTKMTN